mmetsp:Transcript_84086/g.224774  ORF Transcript_84086/g.224774 Transcript_84086/m.224774 type:complete len:224 (+) Transcript_84086:1631-2302(+)
MAIPWRRTPAATPSSPRCEHQCDTTKGPHAHCRGGTSCSRSGLNLGWRWNREDSWTGGCEEDLQIARSRHVIGPVRQLVGSCPCHPRPPTGWQQTDPGVSVPAACGTKCPHHDVRHVLAPASLVHSGTWLPHAAESPPTPGWELDSHWCLRPRLQLKFHSPHISQHRAGPMISCPAPCCSRSLAQQVPPAPPRTILLCTKAPQPLETCPHRLLACLDTISLLR